MATASGRNGYWMLGANDQSLRAKAAFDRDCANDDLTCIYLDHTSRGVSGCDGLISHDAWSVGSLSLPTRIPVRWR